MEIDKVCAIVVTFHPAGDVLENLAAVRPQVQHLIVVDNGSSIEELISLRTGSGLLNFELIENQENLGIATALNQGVRQALARGACWVLLLDQDSQVTPGFTEAMLQDFTSSPCRDMLGTLVPRYIDMRHHQPILAVRLPSGELDSAMTSGSFFPSSIFEHYGFFLDNLFIDCVDSEYSLRLRRAGLLIVESHNAILLHSPGAPQQHSFLGKFHFQTNNYGPLRRYYQGRNRMWIIRHYIWVFPRYSLRLVIDNSKELIKIVLIEKNKLRKLIFFFRGVFDGLRNHMGKLQSV